MGQASHCRWFADREGGNRSVISVALANPFCSVHMDLVGRHSVVCWTLGPGGTQKRTGAREMSDCYLFCVGSVLTDQHVSGQSPTRNDRIANFAEKDVARFAVSFVVSSESPKESIRSSRESHNPGPQRGRWSVAGYHRDDFGGRTG